MKNTIYLDYAAATPVDERVKKAMEPYFTDKFHNPSAAYLEAQEVRRDLEKARALTASNLSVKASEIIFTAGATEANNLAINGVLSKYPDSEVLVSSIEHDSVYEPAGRHKRKVVKVDNMGVVKLDELKTAVTDQTSLISVILVSHELGTIQSLRGISKIVNEIRLERRSKGASLPIYVHTDASQAPSTVGLNLPKLGVDMASLNGGKIYGPKQSGALYVNKQLHLEPLLLGGGQERGLRSGTENVAGSVGFATALDIAQRNYKVEFERLENLRDDFAKLLQKHRITSVINGSRKLTSSHILNVTFAEQDNERLMMELNERGIICAVGSACKAELKEPSRTLTAIGLNENQAGSTLRFSFGRYTALNDIEITVDTLAKLINPHK